MKIYFKIMGIGLLIILSVAVLSYISGWIGVGSMRTLGKAKQNAETEVFFETQAYIEGKNQEGFKLKLEYELEKDETAKLALRRHIVNQFSRVDTDKLDPNLSYFIESLK